MSRSLKKGPFVDEYLLKKVEANRKAGKKEIIKADLVLLAMGFLKPEQPKLAENVFFAGDAVTGPSLVVKCIAAGRQVAKDINKYLS